MYASGSSPPPPDLDASISAATSAPDTPAPIPTTNGSTNQHTSTPPAAPAPSRKRKRGQAVSTAHAASPAPSDPGSTTGKDAADTLLAVRTDLYSRPILSIARGPTFIPVSESSEWCRTETVAFNRLGFRYVPAGIRPQGSITPCRTIESNPTSFRISWEDRSHSLKVTRDGLGLGGSKGFRSARCNAPMREGKWYLEAKIELGGGDRAPDSTAKEGSYVRLGWGRREASLNGPAGMDGYSYGYRDKTGEKVTLSRPRPYGKPFKSGDVVGMYISLPPLRQPNKKDPHDPAHIHRERIPIDLKGQEVFEILEYPVAKEMTALMDHPTKADKSTSVPSSNTKKPATGAKQPDAPVKEKAKPSATPAMRPLPVLKGSRIAFFVNGECQGTAFEDIYDFLPLRQSDTHRKSKGRRAKEGVKEHRENPFDDGTLGYYPMISVFNDAMVKLNPGPHFDFPPPLDIDALLDGRPQPQSSENVKTEPDLAPPEDDAKMDVDKDKKPSVAAGATWRPAIERYPEFMKEQWALDDLEEEEAKVEFEKQKAMEETGELPGGAKGKRKKAAAGKATTTSRKKKTAAESSSKAGTPPVDDPLIAAHKRALQAYERNRKRVKKDEGQASLGVSAEHPTEASTPRSATETPAGTPPPSISSTAAAAAAAHLHLLHHPVSRQDLSNRPSPSPLRQSTAYREVEHENVEPPRNRDELPVVSPPIHAPRPRAPPGSKEGRERAAAAVAAAHAVVVSPPPRSYFPSHSSGYEGHPPSIRVDPAANLMSLASLAAISPTLSTVPLPAPNTLSGPGVSGVPPPLSPIAQHHALRTAQPPTFFGQADDYDLEDEFLAAAGAASGSEPDHHFMEEEEEEDESELDRRPASSQYRYRRYGGGEGTEGEDDGAASNRDFTDRDGEDEGVTTDGDSMYPYDERQDRDPDMDTDYGGTRPQTPA